MSRKINLKKPLKLMEEFAAIEQPDNTTATETNTAVKVDQTGQTGAEIRAEIIADVDTILTNLETLSKQITESVLIMEEDMIDKIFTSMKSTIAIAKAESKLKEYEKLLTLADANMQAAKLAKAGAEIAAAIPKGAKGTELEKAQAKADKAKAKLEAQNAYDKEKYKNAVSEFEAELTEIEADISKDSELGKLYQRRKQMLKNQVAEVGVEANASIQMELKNEATAKKLAEKLEGLKAKQKELAQDIADGKKGSAEDLKELEGIKAYINEIEAIRASSKASADIVDKAKREIGTVQKQNEFYSAWKSENLDLLEGAVADLFSKAKGANDEAALKKAKSLAGELQKAAAAELQAKTALANKIAGKEVPKTIVILAGGDGDKAEETENGYKLTTFIPKYGGGSSIVKPEEYGPAKDAAEVLKDVDDAIAKAGEGGKKDDNEEEELTGQGLKGQVPDKKKIQAKIKALKKELDGMEQGSEDYVSQQQRIKAAEDTLKGMDNNSFMPVEEAVLLSEKDHIVYFDVVGTEEDFEVTKAQAEELGLKAGFFDGEWGTELELIGEPSAIMKMAKKLGMADQVGGEDAAYQITPLEEGNAFGAARAEAIAKGEKTFKVGDEEYDVESVDAEDKENAEEYAEEEGIATEAVTESASFKMGSIADRFKALM